MTSGASFELSALAGGRFAARGVLGFTTARAALECGEQLFGGATQPVEVDFSGVRQADSAGLAVLLAWLSRAVRAGQAIRFVNLPAQLQAIARITEVEQLLWPA